MTAINRVRSPGKPRNVRVPVYFDETVLRILKARALRDKTDLGREIRYLVRRGLIAEGAQLEMPR